MKTGREQEGGSIAFLPPLCQTQRDGPRTYIKLGVAQLDRRAAAIRQEDVTDVVRLSGCSMLENVDKRCSLRWCVQLEEPRSFSGRRFHPRPAVPDTEPVRQLSDTRRSARR